MQIIWSDEALKELNSWRNSPKKIQRIKVLIENIKETPYLGIGKPEPLKYQYSGFWSRRIDVKNRLIYCISERNEIVIESCRGHYSRC